MTIVSLRQSDLRHIAPLLTLIALLIPLRPADAAPREVVLLTAGWRFVRGDGPGAQTPAFDDAAWRTVAVPHDWSIEGPFDPQAPTTGAGAFLPAGVGWYRRSFTLPAGAAARRVTVEFEGVMARSDVWINGFHLGHRPNGYVRLRYDLTGHLHFGTTPNILAVRADNSLQPASRWYAGAGIYRPVRVVITDAVHIEADSVFVTTPQASADTATVTVRARVVNQTNTAHRVSLSVSLVAPDGTVAATGQTAPQSLSAGATGEAAQTLTLTRPLLWGVDHPRLYRAVVRVREANATGDSETIPFGVRTARFDAATGFSLNGATLKIKGVCVHQDGGAFGVAVPVEVWRGRLLALKSLGVNAVRAAHCPFSPDFLDLCDQVGLLVMDEMFDAWTLGKEPFDYHVDFAAWSDRDLRETICRDRNHPSIVLYSAGNEIRDTPRGETARATLAALVRAFHETDPTRPVTQALFRPNVSHDYDNGLADLLDVVGQNYRENELLAAHRQKPSRKIIGTENGHDRRVWLALRDNPALAGQFLWTGIDYLGEARRWPAVGANSGLLDRTGQPRPLGFERASWWSDRPMVYMARRVGRPRLTPTDPGYEAAAQDVLRRPQVLFPDWTPRNPAPHDETVEVYSNCPHVELFLNDKSLGSLPLPADASPRVWRVAFAPGVLRAVAGGGGQPAVTTELRTAGKPARIALALDPAQPGDTVCGLRASVVDADGTLVPDATDTLTFTVTGPARLVATDNGDMTRHAAFTDPAVPASNGRAVAWVETTGLATVAITVSAPGLAPGSVTLPRGKP